MDAQRAANSAVQTLNTGATSYSARARLAMEAALVHAAAVDAAARFPSEAFAEIKKQRLLGVMDSHLAGRQWFMDDDYSIADISMLGWVRNLNGFYGAGELVGFDTFKNVAGWLERGLARPAVQRGLNIPKRP